jgi:radical SAM protein with 4Fe4S-binding SPASM domain
VQLGLRALRTLVEAGARVGVNTVLSGPMLAREGALEAIGAAIAAAGATEWQWLRFKPTGRGATSWEALSATPEQLDALWERSLSLEARTGLTIRWDCAMTPWIADHVDDVQRATRLGVAGCPGGERLWSRHADGRTAPCSFADGAPATEGLAAAWASDPTLLAWRERAANPPAPCDTCTWRDVCRGGCRIVAQHLTGDPASADPQCPRVRAWDPA